MAGTDPASSQGVTHPLPQHLPHPPAGAAQPIGDALLAEARAAPPAGAVTIGFEDPAEQQDGQEQQGQGPCRQAGGGHCREGCG